MGLTLTLQPKQQILSYLLNETDVDIIGYGGSRGGAKSGGGRRLWVKRRFDYPRTTGLILRRTFPELNKSHIEKFLAEFPEIASWYKGSTHQVNFPNGSILYFGSADNENRISQFYSAEMADMMIEEAQEFSQSEIEKLRGSNRCTTNNKIRPKVLLTFMPGPSDAGLPPIGLEYLKRVFIDRKLSDEEKLKKWAFIPARAWDNVELVRQELDAIGIGYDRGRRIPHVPDSLCACQDCQYYSWDEQVRQEFFLRSNYGLTLQSMARDKGLRDAWIFGTFTTFAGQYFQQWDESRHVITAREARERIKPWHKKWLSEDWGFGHPACVHWHAQDETGRVITYRELWVQQCNEIDLAHNIALCSGWSGKLKDAQGKWQGEWKRTSASEDLKAFPISWDAGKQSPRSDRDSPKSFMQLQAESLPKDFPQPFPADSSPGSRVIGARLMSNMLDTDTWQVSEECSRLRDTMPTLMRDPENIEDVLKIDFPVNQIGDDAYDCSRMGLVFMLGVSHKPLEVRRAEVLQKTLKETGDMTAVHMSNIKFEKQYGMGSMPLTMPRRYGR